MLKGVHMKLWGGSYKVFYVLYIKNKESLVCRWFRLLRLTLMLRNVDLGEFVNFCWENVNL